MRRRIAVSMLAGIIALGMVVPFAAAAGESGSESVDAIESIQSGEIDEDGVDRPEEGNLPVEETLPADDAQVEDDPLADELSQVEKDLQVDLPEVETAPLVEGYSLNSVTRAADPDRFSSPVVIGNGWAAITPVFAGNADRVGANDIYGIKSTGEMMFYPRSSAGWGKPVTVGHGWQTMREIVGGVDFTGNGNPDVIAVDKATCDLKLYLGNGKGGFVQANKIGNGWCHMGKIAAAPRGPNGKPIIYAVDMNDGVLYSYQTDGTGKITTKTKFGGGWKTMKTIIGVADWDGNGHSDLFAIASDGRLILYKRLANGFDAAKVVGNGWQTMRAVVNGVSISGRQSLWAVRQNGDLLEYVKELPAETLQARVARLARNYIGVNYVTGGASPAGFDCSGLVSYVYREAGAPFKPNWRLATGDIRYRGTVISKAQAIPGDILWWDGHVAIYLGSGKILHAPKPGTKVQIGDVYGSPLYIRYNG